MYVYIYLDPRKSGKWTYKEHMFHNEPIYVGVGSRSRFVAHWRNTKNNNKEYINPILKNKLKAMLGVRISPIILKIYDKINPEEAFKHEIAIIKHFGKIKNNTGVLANIGDGGETQRIGTIKEQCKPVVMFDLNGNRVRDYESVAAAQFDMTGAPKGKGAVLRNLKGHNYTAYGFVWRYKSDVGNMKKLNVSFLNNLKGNVGSQKKTVYCYNLDGTFNKKYDSVKETMGELFINCSYETLLRNIKKENIIDGLILSYKNPENYVHKTTALA